MDGMQTASIFNSHFFAKAGARVVRREMEIEEFQVLSNNGRRDVVAGGSDGGNRRLDDSNWP